mmetsp:Transcript_4395/g.11543  ORF Transcript_4395/g.11543 Transcript_4395/m.11543 type:complete len:214 (+) Transcript_4395:47-688(+)
MHYLCLSVCLSLQTESLLWRTLRESLSLIVRTVAVIILVALLRQALLQDLIDDPELQGRRHIHEGISIHDALNFRQRLSGMMHEEIIELGPDAQQLPGADLNVAGHALRAAAGLMQHNAGVGQRESLPGFAASKQQTPHAGRLPHADGVDGWPNVLHGVIHGHAGRDAAARAVDVHEERLVGLLGFQEEELRRDEAGHLVVDLAVHADDALPQ